MSTVKLHRRPQLSTRPPAPRFASGWKKRRAEKSGVDGVGGREREGRGGREGGREGGRGEGGGGGGGGWGGGGGGGVGGGGGGGAG